MHPEWSRSCGDCVTWLYGDDGTIVKRAGEPQKRPPGVTTPCHKCPKIPHGAEPRRENAVELSDRNLTAYRHYLECRAVGRFPEDPIVKRNARVCRAIHDEADQRPLVKLYTLLGLGHG